MDTNLDQILSTITDKEKFKEIMENLPEGNSSDHIDFLMSGESE